MIPLSEKDVNIIANGGESSCKLPLLSFFCGRVILHLVRYDSLGSFLKHILAHARY